MKVLNAIYLKSSDIKNKIINDEFNWKIYNKNDVSHIINKLINNNELIIFDKYNDIFGDLYPEYKKKLIIRYKINKNIYIKIYNENQHIVLPDINKKILYICYYGTIKNYMCEYINNLLYYVKIKGQIVNSFDFLSVDNLEYILNNFCHYNRTVIIPTTNIKLNEPYILINSEQVGREIIKKTLIEVNYNKLIDYSFENIKKINELNINYPLLFVPYLYNPENGPHIYNNDKIYDVCVIGEPSPKRSYVYNILKSRGIHIDNIIGWGNNRDELLSKYKILLNIHYDESYNVFESIRCYPLIYNKTIIISEESIKSDTNYFLDDYVIFEKYDNLVNKVIEIIEKYDEYYKKIYCNFDDSRFEREGIEIAKKFLDFCI